MAAGDAASAAGYTVYPDSVLANRIAELIAYALDDLAAKTGDKGAPIPLTLGGTGANSAEAARTALGLVIATSLTGSAGKIPTYSGDGTLAAATPTATNHVTPKSYVDAAVAGIDVSNKVSKSGDTMTGDLKLPNADPATSGYVVCYLNSDGRVSRGASSERYKKFISAIDPLGLGDVWPVMQRFQMRSGDGVWKYGYIAEHLAESEDLQPFVVYDAEGRPDSIDFIALLMVQNAQLHERVKALEARDA